MNKKLDSVQVLRGIAALLVVFYHLKVVNYKYFTSIDLSSFFSYGNSGVDVFFVTSYYMDITKLFVTIVSILLFSCISYEMIEKKLLSIDIGGFFIILRNRLAKL